MGSSVIKYAPLAVIRIANYRNCHTAGEIVMGQFKNELAAEVVQFLVDFQHKRAQISDIRIAEILESAAVKAKENAKCVLGQVHVAMGM